MRWTSREKRLTLYVLAFTCLFIIMMRSSANDELETDFVPNTRTQSLSPSLQLKSDEQFSKQYGEFIQQQADFERVLANNFTESKNVAVRTGTKSPKTNVLLVTAHRSGSTFLGELFNRNSNAFYMFEPLVAVQGTHSTDQCDGLMSVKNAYLSSLFNCTFPVVYRSVKQSEKTGVFSYGGATSRNMPDGAVQEPSPYSGRCSESNLCFRWVHHWACDKALCNGGADTTVKISGKIVPRCIACQPLNRQTMSGLCRERPITALKVIRYCDLNAMEQLANRENVKTIVLFRDPRGIFVSRNKIFNNAGRAIETINKTCKYYYQAVQKVKDTTLFFLRYEDMSSDPLTTAQSIYEFIGQSIPNELRSWIEKSTSVSTADSGGTYSTRRNSTATMTAWRKSISLDNTLTVQKHCADFMRLAGYNLIREQADLSNNSFPVFMKWNY